MERLLQGEAGLQEYRIVRVDGGVRWVRDTYFPIRDGGGAVVRVAGIAQDITAHESSLVYVVDDGEASRRDVFHLLQGAGYDVKGFAPGQAFLEVVPALAVGCVLLNMRAPGAEGLAILRDMKARGIDLPVIVTGERCGDAGLAWPP